MNRGSGLCRRCNAAVSEEHQTLQRIAELAGQAQSQAGTVLDEGLRALVAALSLRRPG